MMSNRRLTINARLATLLLAGIAAGCMPKRVPVKATPMGGAPASTAPMSPTPAPTTGPTTSPVATSDLGNTPPTPGLFPKKPFIKTDPHFGDRGNPSTLLLEHASPDSPIPLSEFGSQPVRSPDDFHLHAGLTADEVQKQFGPPAQLADVEDPWLVYRLTNTRELWLHFQPAGHGRLVEADVVRGAESGYVRTPVFRGDATTPGL